MIHASLILLAVNFFQDLLDGWRFTKIREKTVCHTKWVKNEVNPQPIILKTINR